MDTSFRRKAPRRDYEGLVGVLHKGKMTTNRCVQVGEGGALVKGSPEVEEIQNGDGIVVTIFFPNIGGIVAKADCLYRNEEGSIGIAFQDISMEFKKRIREYVSRQKS